MAALPNLSGLRLRDGDESEVATDDIFWYTRGKIERMQERGPPLYGELNRCQIQYTRFNPCGQAVWRSSPEHGARLYDPVAYWNHIERHGGVDGDARDPFSRQRISRADKLVLQAFMNGPHGAAARARFGSDQPPPPVALRSPKYYTQEGCFSGYQHEQLPELLVDERFSDENPYGRRVVEREYRAPTAGRQRQAYGGFNILGVWNTYPPNGGFAQSETTPRNEFVLKFATSYSPDDPIYRALMADRTQTMNVLSQVMFRELHNIHRGGGESNHAYSHGHEQDTLGPASVSNIRTTPPFDIRRPGQFFSLAMFNTHPNEYAYPNFGQRERARNEPAEWNLTVSVPFLHAMLHPHRSLPPGVMDLEALEMIKRDPAAAQAALPEAWKQPSISSEEIPKRRRGGGLGATETVRMIDDGGIAVYMEMYGALMCCMRKFIERLLYGNGFGVESNLQFAFAAPAERDVPTVWAPAGAPGTRGALNAEYLRDSLAQSTKNMYGDDVPPEIVRRYFSARPTYLNRPFYDLDEPHQRYDAYHAYELDEDDPTAWRQINGNSVQGPRGFMLYRHYLFVDWAEIPRPRRSSAVAALPGNADWGQEANVRRASAERYAKRLKENPAEVRADEDEDMY